MGRQGGEAWGHGSRSMRQDAVHIVVDQEAEFGEPGLGKKLQRPVPPDLLLLARFPSPKGSTASQNSACQLGNKCLNPSCGGKFQIQSSAGTWHPVACFFLKKISLPGMFLKSIHVGKCSSSCSVGYLLDLNELPRVHEDV